MIIIWFQMIFFSGKARTIPYRTPLKFTTHIIQRDARRCRNRLLGFMSARLTFRHALVRSGRQGTLSLTRSEKHASHDNRFTKTCRNWACLSVSNSSFVIGSETANLTTKGLSETGELGGDAIEMGEITSDGGDKLGTGVVVGGGVAACPKH